MSAGTEFNAFELLAKLRGGQPLPESSVGGAVPTNPHAKHAQQTSVQKRERIEVRVELEKDIAKLNEEIMKLKYENKQLQAGKAELQQQLKEQKENSDDTIAQLRNTIIGLRKRVNNGGATAGASMANNFDGTGASNRLAIPGRQSSQPLTNPAINRQLQYMPPPPPGMNQFGLSASDNQENFPRNGSPDWQAQAQNRSPSPTKKGQDPNNPFPGTTTTTLRRNSNFAGPTFSELMRRSAPVYKDFSSSLRDTKAFYVATPTVITNANQDPQFAVARRQSIAMHQAKVQAQMGGSGGYNSSGEGQFGGYGSSDDMGYSPSYQPPLSASVPVPAKSTVSASPPVQNVGAVSAVASSDSTPANPVSSPPAPPNPEVRGSIEQHKPFAW